MQSHEVRICTRRLLSTHFKNWLILRNAPVNKPKSRRQTGPCVNFFFVQGEGGACSVRSKRAPPFESVPRARGIDDQQIAAMHNKRSVSSLLQNRDGSTFGAVIATTR